MPIYTLRCDCGHEDEFHMSPNDVALAVECEACGAQITRHTHRAWDRDHMMVIGDTVVGGPRRGDYFDNGLGVYVTSEHQRKNEMKRQGMREWAPDPVERDMLSEMRYIRKNSDMSTDASAVKAAREVGVVADKKRKRQAIKAVVSRGMAEL
jgi:hypothetical protein